MLDKLVSYWRGRSTAAEEPLALYHAGEIEQAERVASDRLARAASDRGALLTRAFLLTDQGRGKDAIAIAQQLLAGNARDAQAWLAIGRAHAVAGRRKPAGEALEAALQRDGGDPAILAEAALLALAEGRQEMAAQHLSRARGKARRLALAHRELAGFLLQRGQVAASERQLQQALAAHPGDAIAHANLGAVRKDLGRSDEAVQSFERALALQPQLSEAAFNLAMLRIDRREWGAAAALLRDYLAQHPRDAEAHYWLGHSLMGDADAAGARAAYEAAVRIDSQHVRARWGAVMAHLPAVAASEQEQAQGLQAFERDLDRLCDWCRTQARADAWQAVGAQQPLQLASIEGNHAAVLRRYGALCAELMATWAKRAKVPPPAAARPGERLRVGLVTAHGPHPSVAHALLRGWVRHLDRERFELHLFHVGRDGDDDMRWAQGQVASLQPALRDWAACAKAVSEARLDVVIYPGLGADASTLRLASLRLARVQLAGWGHPLTTGLPTIDGYLSAQAFEPAAAAEHYSESLHALPGLGCAYRPSGARPEAPQWATWGIAPGDRLLVAPGPAFQYGPREDALWVEIARRCAACKLLFFRGDDGLAARLEQRLRAAFAAAQVEFDAHVRFVPRPSPAAFFGLLQRADVVLDPVGCSGFDLAMQAVECGTPLVAWQGGFLRGRFASGILRSLQLDEWIADSHAAYADRVVRLCEDAAVRERVRQQIVARRGALYDDVASVQALGALLQQLAV